MDYDKGGKNGNGVPYRCAMAPKRLWQPWVAQKELFQRMRQSETTSFKGEIKSSKAQGGAWTIYHLIFSFRGGEMQQSKVHLF